MNPAQPHLPPAKVGGAGRESPGSAEGTPCLQLQVTTCPTLAQKEVIQSTARMPSVSKIGLFHNLGEDSSSFPA